MNRAESQVTARRSLPVGVFSLVVAGILVLISGLWIRYGNFPGWLLPVALAVLEVGIAVIMLRPLNFRVLVGPAGIRSEGHAPWTLGPHEIVGAGVLTGRHPTLWATPSERLSRSERGFTLASDAPRGAHLVPVDPSAVPQIQRVLTELGFADGSARLDHPRNRPLTGRPPLAVQPLPAPDQPSEAQTTAARITTVQPSAEGPRPRRARRAAPDDTSGQDLAPYSPSPAADAGPGTANSSPARRAGPS